MHWKILSQPDYRQPSKLKLLQNLLLNEELRHLEKGRVVIFGSGTGNPYFTTDSAAVLRAIEINTDVILKGTRVDGIYNEDPEKNKSAVKFDNLSFDEVLKKGSRYGYHRFYISQENKLPIIVFDINIKGNLSRIVKAKIGTRVDFKISPKWMKKS